MAEVGAVYDVAPVPRNATDIIGGGDDKAEPPTAKNKWLTASVVEDAATVIASVFDEAERRDPNHQRTWVALVDGNNHQISRIETEAAARGVELTVLVDVVHVLEYLWSAAWSFFAEGDAAAESWVAGKALSVLEGNASTVAASIRRKATRRGLDAPTRKNADTCADYLLAKRDYLDYPLALNKGWPIATGVIEGACRHLVKDRMVFSSPEAARLCPRRRLTVLVGYGTASYRHRRDEVSRGDELSSVPDRAARRTGLLECDRWRLRQGRRR